MTLNIEESIILYYPKDLFKKTLKEYIDKNQINKNKKLVFIIKDSTGEIYKILSAFKAKEYLK